MWKPKEGWRALKRRREACVQAQGRIHCKYRRHICLPKRLTGCWRWFNLDTFERDVRCEMREKLDDETRQDKRKEPAIRPAVDCFAALLLALIFLPSQPLCSDTNQLRDALAPRLNKQSKTSCNQLTFSQIICCPKN